MDIIKLKNLRFYGYHGVLEEEKKIGQKFIVDLKLYADLKEACLNDNVTDTVHYGLVYELVKEIVENNKFDLIEKLAQVIATSIFDEFKKVKKIEVEIKKPEAPVNGIYDYFSVLIERSRNE
ncbi:dihydroneopterin aldolase [Clostridiaceae bacterium HSG29]|nr:dihydroneopterin aldolase [Clostridiaceae bacterium HSG29]